MKTLIAEDDFTSRLLLQQLLAPYGECHSAVNGKEALEAFEVANHLKLPYDLICLDINMPEVDGQAVLKEIRISEKVHGVQADKRARIIMMTALHDEVNVMTAIRGACDGYMVKPINKAKLLGQLRNFELIS
jgi:two-component system chemotaxis response regulator CheY